MKLLLLPTFDDVATGAWYLTMSRPQYSLALLTVIQTLSGNLTGYFGPADTVNRAAATKILVNAFSVPTDLDPCFRSFRM